MFATAFLMTAALAISASGAAEPAVPYVRMRMVERPPKLDGRIEEAEWNGACRQPCLIGLQQGEATARQAIFWLGSDGKQLFLAVRSEAPPDGRVLQRAVADAQRDVVAAFHDDSLEFVIDPRRGRAAGDRRYWHLITNGRGALYDWAVDPDNRQNATDLTWRLPDWKIASALHDGWWDVEVGIPCKSIGAEAEDFGRPWGLEIGRNWRRPSQQSQWSPLRGSYDDRARMPMVEWDSHAPVVQVFLDPAARPLRLAVAVRNPSEQPQAIRAVLADAWHRDPPRETAEDWTLGPGETRRLELEIRPGGPEGAHQTSVVVQGARDGKLFYRRQWKWTPHRPEIVWTIGEEQRQAVDLQFKYYPYSNQIGYQVGIGALAVRDRVTGAVGAIHRADAAGKPQTPPLWQQPIHLHGNETAGIAEIPVLPEGRYLFAVTLKGSPGVPTEPVVQPFVRQVFPWEHNTLGISREVMPPFTPLAVDGPVIGAVLRRHRHGSSGLWDSVESEGAPLLAGPLSWEVLVDGEERPAPVTGSGWKATRAESTTVEGVAQWSAGPVSARVLTQYDYDGMMLLTLEVEPRKALSPKGASTARRALACAALHEQLGGGMARAAIAAGISEVSLGQGDKPAGSELARLSLLVPLRESMGRYMHAVGDGLRHNYAGFVPAGQGKIWDSNRANKLEIVGSFFPYLWIGDGERGLAWFADTDRDWVLDDKTPTLELHRQGDQLLLRVNLITRPGALAHKRRIQFGLQATPTKPMPDGWRRWVASKPVPGGRPVRWLGASYYWGGMSYDVYPHRGRFEYFDAIKATRQTGQPDPGFIQRWMTAIEQEVAKPGTQRHEFLLRHVRAGIYGAKAAPWSEGWRLFGYTNPRGTGFQVPEFATFQDEWLRYRWFNRKWGTDGDVGYDVSPCRSYQDYALWYYRKMLTCFDGVYWDNLFLSANFDPVVGEAWTDDHGRVHPTMGLFHLRELCKRTAIMLWQETKNMPPSRRPPITLAHMTNTLLVPVMSFVNCTMDWEWKYGYDDFQDRFSPDLTVAETIGRAVGAWPTILSGGHPDPKDPRTARAQRTRLGVCLVHEIQVFDHGPPAEIPIYQKLFEFGYGNADTQVSNYWQAKHPVRATRGEVRTLAMSNDRGAIVVVTDYGSGGEVELAIDHAGLRLPPGASAVDLESGQPVAATAGGTYQFPLEKHNFRILKFSR